MSPALPHPLKTDTKSMVKTNVGISKKTLLAASSSASEVVKSANSVNSKIEKNSKSSNSSGDHGSSTGVVQKKNKTSKGACSIDKKDKQDKKDKKKKKTPFFHQLKKVRHPAQVKNGLIHIFDQLVSFPSKKLAEMFMENGIADVVESSNSEKIEASKSRKERAVLYSNKTRVAFVGREAANTLMVILYNPASVSVLMEEIKANTEFPAHILVVRFDSAFVVIITDENVSSRFPYRSSVERGESTSCFIWFNIKEISWSQKFPSRNQNNVKLAVLQKATPLTVMGHVIVAYFEARSKPWQGNSIKDDKTNFHIYLKPTATLDDPSCATDDELAGLNWVEKITDFVSIFSVVKGKANKENTSVNSKGIEKSTAVEPSVVLLMEEMKKEVEKMNDLKEGKGPDDVKQQTIDVVEKSSQTGVIDTTKKKVDELKQVESVHKADDVQRRSVVDVMDIDSIGTNVLDVRKNEVEAEILIIVNSLVFNIIEKDHLEQRGETLSTSSGEDKMKIIINKPEEKLQDDINDTTIQNNIDIGVCGMSKGSHGYFNFDQDHDFYEDDDSGMYDAIRNGSKWLSPKGRYS